MYHFIINPKSSSGKGIRYWWTVKEILDKNRISYSADFTKHEGHARELAEQICSKTSGIKNIVVLGGDGTLNEVLNGITGIEEILLGYIPSGSSNDLGRNLGISKDPEKALANVLKPTKFKYLDYGIIDFHDNQKEPRKFIGSSGFGYDAEVCMEVQACSLKEKLNRYGLGKLVYFALALKKLMGLKLMDATVMIDGVRKETFERVMLVSSMIHRYEGGGMMMAPDADPSDGKLSVCLVHGLGRMKILLLLPTIFLGKHVKYKGVETFQCSNIEINTSRDTAVHTDGEVAAVCSHISVSCVPGKIRMIL